MPTEDNALTHADGSSRLVEVNALNEFYPVEEDGQRHIYILNSRDLCMIEHIPELIEAGVSSAKIEEL